MQDRHVLAAAPVGLQVWEASGEEPHTLALRYANAAGERFPRWTQALYEACVAQEARTLELAAGDAWWRRPTARARGNAPGVP